MEDLITVFRMTELSTDVRCKLIIKLGDLINYKYGSNVTEPMVFELVSVLNPQHEILQDKRMRVFALGEKHDLSGSNRKP